MKYFIELTNLYMFLQVLTPCNLNNMLQKDFMIIQNQVSSYVTKNLKTIEVFKAIWNLACLTELEGLLKF